MRSFESIRRRQKWPRSSGPHSGRWKLFVCVLFFLSRPASRLANWSEPKNGTNLEAARTAPLIWSNLEIACEPADRPAGRPPDRSATVRFVGPGASSRLWNNAAPKSRQVAAATEGRQASRSSIDSGAEGATCFHLAV